MQGTRTIAIALAITVAAFSLAPACADAAGMESAVKTTTRPDGQYDWLIKNATILKLLKLHNEARARYGRPPLTLNTQMCLQAQAHAKKMATYGWFAHSGLPYYENIAYSQRTAEAAVQTWIYSPAHNANLQRGTQVGFGYALRNGQPYWVAVFR